MSQQMLALSREQLAEFCTRWKITELALFGSVLREDFGPASDIDVLVSFHSDAKWGLLDHVQMEQELSVLLGRDVDLVSKRAIQGSANWLRREEILDTADVVFDSGVEYAAG